MLARSPPFRRCCACTRPPACCTLARIQTLRIRRPSRRAHVATTRPWRVRKLYVGEGFQATGDPKTTLRVETGAFDPLLGRTYFEVAMEGRSQHRSQRQGAVEQRGERSSGIRLLKTVVAAGPVDPL